MNEVKPKIEATVIEDNSFMDKDVSELVKGDFYLFHMTGDKMYFYKDGVVIVGSLLDDCGGVVHEYKEGTLRSYIERLGGGLWLI